MKFQKKRAIWPSKLRAMPAYLQKKSLQAMKTPCVTCTTNLSGVTFTYKEGYRMKYLIIHGELQVKRKEEDLFQKGDAIWSNDAKVEIYSRHDSLEEARKQLALAECSYNHCGVRGMYVEEYALVVCRIDEDGVYFFKDNYELAKEEAPCDGGSIIVCEKYVLDGDYRTRQAINVAIRNKEHISEDFFDEWCDWENWVEWKDGKTIILEEFALY